MQKPAHRARVVGDPTFALDQDGNHTRRPYTTGEARGQRTLFDERIHALALLCMQCGFPTSSRKMMSAEPGKATTDKKGQPVGDGAKADRKPIGNSGKGVAVMNA